MHSQPRGRGETLGVTIGGARDGRDEGGRHPEAMERTSVTVTLELRIAGECISGSASDGAGAYREFAGWLGLIAAIDALTQPIAPSLQKTLSPAGD